MKVLVAADKFKGSLSAADVAAQVVAGLRSVVPAVAPVAVPIADGGEGTLAAALSAGFRFVPVLAEGPTGAVRNTGYAVRDGVAVVELADVSGLACLPEGGFAPLAASSYGTGQVLRAALDAGAHRIVLGVGGSACTDGGAGMVQALGGRLLDDSGAEIERGGAALATVDRLILDGLHPGLVGVELVIASDVDNPLGDAATVYGPQKGASAGDVRQLDSALRRWAQVVHATTGLDMAGQPGTGAAGGVGYGAVALLGAVRRSGIETVMELIGFRDQLRGATVVITGEGTLDEQTLRGKAPAGVAAAARAAGVPVIAVAGRCELSAAASAAAGIERVYSLADREPDPQQCMANAGALLRRVAAEIARDWLLDVD